MNNLKNQIHENKHLIINQKKLMRYEINQIKNDTKVILTSPVSLCVAFLIGFILTTKLNQEERMPQTYAAQARRNKGANKIINLGKLLLHFI